MDGFLRATNTFIAGKTFAVVGFGWCGRSLARTLRAMGAIVIVVEIDPVRALEAAYEGMLVTTIDRAAERADTIITVTGRPGVVTARRSSAPQGRRDARQHGPLLDRDRRRRAARAGDRLARWSNTHVEEFDLPNGRRVHLLARGEMLNLTAATGHQIEIMDLGFALQAHAMRILSADPGGVRARLPAGARPREPRDRGARPADDVQRGPGLIDRPPPRPSAPGDPARRPAGPGPGDGVPWPQARRRIRPACA